MRQLAVAICMILLTGCGPASRLTYSERAFIHCSETRRDLGTCIQGVMAGWDRLARVCGIRGGILYRCDAEFDRLYFCDKTTREEKVTDEKGNVTIRKVESETGPGCGLSSSRLYELGAAYRNECEWRNNSPDTSSVEGARCSCGGFYCNFAYPDVTDDTAVRYFPEKADK